MFGNLRQPSFDSGFPVEGTGLVASVFEPAISADALEVVDHPSNGSADNLVMYYPNHSQHQLPFPQAGRQNQNQNQMMLNNPYQNRSTDDTPSSMDSHNSPAFQNENGKRPSISGLGSSSSSRKRARKDSDPDASPAAQSPQDAYDSKEGKPKATRGARACTVCRRLKMKCVVLPELKDGPCKRCQAGNHECIFEESNRGKRSSKKHEQLTKSLQKMERTLDTVLRSISNPALTGLAGGMVSQSPSPVPDGESSNHEATGSPDRGDYSSMLAESVMSRIPATATYGAAVNPVQGSPRLHSLPDNVLNPLGLLAEASSSLRRGKQAADESQSTPGGSLKHPMSLANLDNPKVGVANLGVYFKPGPMTILPLRQLIIERQVQPEMLSFVPTDIVVQLFKIYFEHMNPQTGLLDINFHTPALICARSPFLLTTICAISSKFYTGSADEELHTKLVKLANKLAWSVPERGYKSVEIVQAYLLLSLWGSPVERYEHDRTWMLLGMAIRMATDLNLHRKNTHIKAETPEGRAREVEIRNRERTWLLCFILDRSFSAQMGKPNTIKEDFIIRDAAQWCRQPGALAQDIGGAGYVELQRIVSRSLDFLYAGTTNPSGLQTACDYMQIIRAIESQVDTWITTWAPLIQNADHHTDYRQAIAKFYYHYAMLVLNSFGLQNAFERSPVDMGYFFGRCHTSATSCCLLIKDELGPAGYLRYAPDSHFVLISYAVLSLLKLVRPEFRGYVDQETKTLSLVGDVADILQAVAVNKYHTPYLYSVFLRALLTSKMEGSRPSSPRTSQSKGETTSNGPVFSQNDAGMAVNGTHFSTTTDSPSRNAFNAPAPNPYEMYGVDMYRSLGENYGDMSNFVNPFAVDINSPGNLLDPMASFGAVGLDQNAPMSLDSFLSAGFWDSMLVPGFSNTLEGMSGGFIYGPGGSGFISRLHSPVGSRRQTPKGEQRPLPTSVSLEAS